MKNFIYVICMTLGVAAAAVAMNGRWETIYIPDGKKAVIVPIEMPDVCITARGWELEAPSDPEDCLVVSPATECSE